MNTDIKIPKEILALTIRLSKTLPGLKAQLRAAPPYRAKSISLSDVQNARKASVLWLMYPSIDNGCEGVLIERGEYEGVHSKQISLPGGEHEETDIDDLDTAIRELKEELGVAISRNNIIGALTPIYIPPSKFIVAPFVAWLPQKPVWDPEEKEVASVITCKMGDLSSPSFWGKHNVSGNIVPGFKIESHIVWGATAMILSELIECWDIPLQNEGTILNKR